MRKLGLDQLMKMNSIAIHAHCFYVNTSNYIIRLIKDLPFEADVYISTNNNSIAIKFETELSQSKSIGALTISVTPNIGRNFGPMLVEFAEDLMRYDLICHIHTKESIHSKDEGVEWGKYLIDGIIGNRNAINRIIHGFISNADWGVAYPQTHPVVPLWAQHWLGNYGLASNWSNKLGISISSGFQNFPTGGMFWARPTAIWQLLNHKWKYSDFPEEMAQLDGTLHHAIERIVGSACNFNGHKQIVYDPDKMLFYEKSLTQRDFDRYNAEVKNFTSGTLRKFVTFDFLSLFNNYETDLYKRTVSLLDKELFEAGKTNCLGEVFDLRSLKELSAASDGRWAGNLNLKELVIGITGSINVNEETLIRREIEIMSSILTKDRQSEAYYNQAIGANIPVVLISSLPYDERSLINILKNAGFILPDSIICLYDISGKRSDGSMWNCIMEKLNCKSYEIVHFGKNVVEDVRNPIFHGISSYLII